MYAYPDQTTRLPDPDVRPDFYDSVPLRRLLAWFVDVTLVTIVAVVMLPFTAFTGIFFFPLMMLVIGFFYRWTMLANASATLGMLITGIQIRDSQGQQLSNRAAMLHTFGYQVSIAFFVLQAVSVLMMLTGRRKQGLTDHMLGTAAICRPL
ncbi:RDD family protein [Pelagovum pacificum]|uniref:RDD family protein n=2 Tax=Pelagovum pacificum TaxID=2588711 RepID=A0A5C5GHQ0_9RHOB|nr:RDD family protein [Pelagovum pacificum]TNY34308.1 RDD family protein [Pelagovum pacificum]